MTRRIEQIAIIGLGQVGGSLAWAFKQCSDSGSDRAPAPVVTGCDREDHVVSEALRRGIIDRAIECDEVATADLVILATPVGEIIALVPRVAKSMKAGSILLDVGSTKGEIVAEMNRSARAVQRAVHCFGGHPVSGTERSGPEGWDRRFFADRPFVIVETESSRPEAKETLTVLLTAIGSTVVFMDAGAHDALLDAGNFIATIERRQGMKIACIEEIAWRNGWITPDQLSEIAGTMPNSDYSRYLLELLSSGH